MQFSSNVEKLKPSATIAVSTLAKKLAAEGRDIINLSAGEPDFDTPMFIADAAVEGIRSGRTRYTPPAGLPELRKAIAANLAERSGREMDWEGVVVTAGAKQGLFNAIFTLFGPGDEVLIAAPYWTTYPDLVTIARAEPVEVFGDASRGFKITPADLDGALSGAGVAVTIGKQGHEEVEFQLSPTIAWTAELAVPGEGEPENLMATISLPAEFGRGAVIHISADDDGRIGFEGPALDYGLFLWGEDLAMRNETIALDGSAPRVDAGRFELELSALAKLAGKPAPGWHVTAARNVGADGLPALGDFAGKWILLEFWGHW